VSVTLWREREGKALTRGSGVAAGACPERSRRMGDRPADHNLGGGRHAQVLIRNFSIVAFRKP
jgi:hypothetical protein